MHPVFIILNLVLSLVIAILSLLAHFYMHRRLGKKSAFWPLIACAWVVFGHTYAFRLAGVGFGFEEWYMVYSRVVGYIIVLIALVALILETKSSK